MKAAVASFQFTGSRHDLPPLGAQRLHLPGVVDRGERLKAVAQRRRAVVEVDPRAAAPQLASHRHQAKVVGAQVVLVERFGRAARRCCVRRFPSTSRGTGTRRYAGIPVALHQLHPAMAARVVVGPHVLGVKAHDDDGLVEDLVFDEVAGLGDLLEPARHLPHARPEQLVLQLVELRVVVPLLGNPVRRSATAHGTGSGAQFTSMAVTPLRSLRRHTIRDIRPCQ